MHFDKACLAPERWFYPATAFTKNIVDGKIAQVF
jgi:hypothetical protein